MPKRSSGRDADSRRLASQFDYCIALKLAHTTVFDVLSTGPVPVEATTDKLLKSPAHFSQTSRDDEHERKQRRDG